MLTDSHRRRLRLWLIVALAGVGVGIVYGAMVGLAQGAAGGPLTGAWIGALVGVVHGGVIAGALGGFEIFWMRTATGRRLAGAALPLLLLAKFAFYGAVILAVEVAQIGQVMVSLLLDRPVRDEPFGMTQWIGLLFSAVVAALFVLALQIGRVVGARHVGNLLFARYHRPRTERRFFLFVDVVGSTALAERLGPVAVHRFLNAVFTAASEPVVEHGGDIYQYVGDQMVVTWTAAAGARDARAALCFLAVEDALAARAAAFECSFGAVPTLRAALHFGDVVAGEIGDAKRDIVFHGDVMNATSRLEGLTRALGARYLASADAMAALPPHPRLAARDMGEHPLRGRAAPLRAFAIERR